MQISEELFIALLKYHLVERDDVLSEIKKGLEERFGRKIGSYGKAGFIYKI